MALHHCHSAVAYPCVWDLCRRLCLRQVPAMLWYPSTCLVPILTVLQMHLWQTMAVAATKRQLQLALKSCRS